MLLAPAGSSCSLQLVRIWTVGTTTLKAITGCVTDGWLHRRLMPGPFHLLCTRRSPTAAAIALVLGRPPALCIAGAERTRILAGAPVVTVGCRVRRGRRCARDVCADLAHHGVFLRLRDEPLSLATAVTRTLLTLVSLRWNCCRAGEEDAATADRRRLGEHRLLECAPLSRHVSPVRRLHHAERSYEVREVSMRILLQVLHDRAQRRHAGICKPASGLRCRARQALLGHRQRQLKRRQRRFSLIRHARVHHGDEQLRDVTDGHVAGALAVGCRPRAGYLDHARLNQVLDPPGMTHFNSIPHVPAEGGECRVQALDIPHYREKSWRQPLSEGFTTSGVHRQQVTIRLDEDAGSNFHRKQRCKVAVKAGRQGLLHCTRGQ